MRWLARYFARAIVRRVAYLVVAGILAVLVQTCAPAHAAVYGDQGEAMFVCQAELAKALAAKTNSGKNYIADQACVQPSNGNRNYACVVKDTSLNVYYGCHFFNGGAQGEGDYSWPLNMTCAARNSTQLADAAQSYSEAGVTKCVGGCAVQGTSFSTQTGGVMVYGMKDRTYSGQACVPAKPSTDISQVQAEKTDAATPKGQECTALEAGQTACMKTNGDYCATASTGKTFCWKPQETGKKADGTEAQVKSPKGEPVTPPSTTISGQEWQRKEGHQQTACVNSTCTTHNVTNYSSVPAGTSKNSTGDNTSTGTGNTSGNGAPGKGTGGKDGDDDGDSASDSGNCTVPPVCVGDTLKCLHLKFTWKTKCNTERSEVTGGSTCADGDVPVCAGDSCKAAEYAGVLQQWRQRCGLERDRQLAGNDAASGASDAASDDESGAVSKLWKEGNPVQLDQNKISIGGGDLMGQQVQINGIDFGLPAKFYEILAMVRKIIIAAAMVMAIYIVWKR